MPKGKTTGGNTTTKSSGNITNVRKGKPGQTLEQNVVTNTEVATTTGNAIEGTGSFAPGPWESGKQGKWEQGAVGQWKSQPEPGPWESGTKVGGWAAGTKVGKWQKGATGQWAGGDGHGGMKVVGDANPDLTPRTPGFHEGFGNIDGFDGAGPDSSGPSGTSFTGGGAGTGTAAAAFTSSKSKALASDETKSTRRIGLKKTEQPRARTY